MKIEGAVFDMDGTMFDSERLSVYGCVEAGKEFGIEVPLDFLIRCMGLPSAVITEMYYERYGRDFDYPSYRARKMAHMTEKIEREGVPVKPGLSELLDDLEERSIPCAVATSTDRDRAQYMLKQAGVLHRFRTVVCGDRIARGKPEPDIFLKAAEEMGARPEACIAMEDSRNGILSASRAGMRAFLIPDMIPPDDEMKAAAFAVVESLYDVLEFLRQEENSR